MRIENIGVKDVVRQYWAMLRPQRVDRVNIWADNKRILPGEGSSAPGPWRTTRNPPAKEIMECLSYDHPAKEVCVVSPTQWGKTEILLNFLFANQDQRPGPSLCVQPTINDVKKFVNQRYDASLKYMPELAAKVGNAKGKGGDSVSMKMFPGGCQIFGWSNSAANLASMPIMYLAFDECDRYAFDADGEGCPIELALARIENFPGAKVLYISTPANAIDSRIWPRFEAGDQRLCMVPCWHCGEYFFMDWPQMEWEKENGRVIPESCRIKCPKCEYLNEEIRKTKMLEEHKWVAQNPAGDYPSFRINALYKPFGWGSWYDIVNGYRSAKRKGITAFKVWHNTKRALPWEPKGTKAEENHLFARREIYNNEVPEPVKIITAGVDVQDDRLEAESVGWGPGFESWGIDRVIFYGDTSKDRVWTDLDEWLRSWWMRDDDMKQFIAAACIDVLGHRTEKVYKFCKPRESRRVFPAYGKNGEGLPIVSKPTRRHRNGCYLFGMGNDSSKDELLEQMLTPSPGPSFCHWPKTNTYDLEYFKQLTAEARVKEVVENREKWVWKKIRERNEAFDIRRLARVALEITEVDLDKMRTYLAQPTDLTPRKTRRRNSSGVKL